MLQSSSETNLHSSSGKTDADTASATRTTLSTISAGQTTVSLSALPVTTASIVVHPTVKNEKPVSNTSLTSQNSRFVSSTQVTMTPYHIPKGTATVASISVPKGKISGSIVRTNPISQIQGVTNFSGNTTSGLISSLGRSTTLVVNNSPSTTTLPKTGPNVATSTYARPLSSLSVTSRVSASPVGKPLETTAKPIILHNASKQYLTQASNQVLSDRSGGVLRTNVGMVTIRGSTTPTMQSQARALSVPAQNSQSPRVTMLVPTSATVRKPQTLAPKVITPTTRSQFTVQSIPVSVSHAPSALTMNKKTAGITIVNNQTSVAGSIVRASPTVVASNSMIAVNEMRATTPTANVLTQAAPKTQVAVQPSSASMTTFSAPAKAYMLESDSFQVKRTLVSSSPGGFTPSISSLTTSSMPRLINVVPAVNTSQIPKLNPIMVMESPRVSASTVTTSPSSGQQSSALTFQSYVIPQGTSLNTVQQSQPAANVQRVSPVPQQPTTMKQNASPRPSILRKRDVDGCIAKAQRNLTPLLNSVAGTSSTVPSPPASPHLTEVVGGQSSNSSSTLSATSSPGVPNVDLESPPKAEKSQIIIAGEEEQLRITSSLVEMSPRKKPRKQQLTGNSTIEPKLEDDMEFISDEKIENKSRDIAGPPTTSQDQRKSSSSSTKKPNISILSGYNLGWKSKHHHFLRYSDVKFKEDKKPTVSDIANQKHVIQKINGWKIYHLSAQMEDLHDIEIEVVNKLSSLLKLFSSKGEDEGNKNVDRTNELIMGNMQRSKVVSDQLKEAKTQMMKVFNHKKHVSDIINKYASKRTIKKKGRY